MEEKWLGVWGNGRTAAEAGVLSEHASRAEAEAAVTMWLDRQDNPAVGAWVRRANEEEE